MPPLQGIDFDLCPLCRGLTRGTKTSSGRSSSLRPLQMFPTQRKRWEGREWMGVHRLLCRRERSTNRVSGRERQPRRRISSTCRRFSSSPEAGSSQGLRMRACCSPRGCSGCKTSSVCLCHLLTLTFLYLPGVSALFTWGVIAENGTTHIAVVPGGWTEDQLEDPTTYLKVSLVNPHLQIVTKFFFS